jgi:hypothetical protein
MDAPAPPDRWQCPWCNSIAANESGLDTLCESRSCSCGALGLAHPSVDLDELVDEAIGIFQARINPSSHGYNDLLLEDVRQSGVEIVIGQCVDKPGGLLTRYQHIWFRKSVSGPGA